MASTKFHRKRTDRPSIEISDPHIASFPNQHPTKDDAPRVQHNRCDQRLDGAHDGIEDLRLLNILKARLANYRRRLGTALRQRPYFDPQTQQIVSRIFLSRAEEERQEIKSLKKQINQKTKEHDSVVSLWQDALQELEEAKSSKKSLTVDDDVITSKWMHLLFIIKNLSTLHLNDLEFDAINVTSEALDR
ncbi:hypothetical protein F4802DRAFT_600525 [Xylaria palmicola]|nr:hypothetical protein F4802DRAFT_600525 [Xylaria palmicola]